MPAPPLPAALVCRGIGRLLCRVKDSAGQRLAITRTNLAADPPPSYSPKDEARRIAANITKLPEFLRRDQSALVNSRAERQTFSSN